MKDPNKTCKSCAFYDEGQNAGPTGTCHRNAPAGAGTGQFPIIRETDWCGEHQPDADTDATQTR